MFSIRLVSVHICAFRHHRRDELVLRAPSTFCETTCNKQSLLESVGIHAQKQALFQDQFSLELTHVGPDLPLMSPQLDGCA